MTFRLAVASDARQQIDDAAAWWRIHRAAAPHLLADEVAAAFTALASAPHIGRRVRIRGVPGARRYVLPATRYHLYYLVDGDTVRVLALWSAIRRGRPRLTAK